MIHTGEISGLNVLAQSRNNGEKRKKKLVLALHEPDGQDETMTIRSKMGGFNIWWNGFGHVSGAGCRWLASSILFIAQMLYLLFRSTHCVVTELQLRCNLVWNMQKLSCHFFDMQTITFLKPCISHQVISVIKTPHKNVTNEYKIKTKQRKSFICYYY